MQSPFLLLFVCTNMLGVIALSACDTTSGTPTKPENAIEVTFAYSSEKQPWIDPLAAKFNSEQHKVPGDNRPIYITAQVWDSGKVSSADETDIPYGGPALASDSTYSWS